MPVAFARYRHVLPLAGVLIVAGGLYLRLLSKWFWTDDVIFLHAFRDYSALGYMKDVLDFRHAPPPPVPLFYRPFHSGEMLGLYEVFGVHAAPFHGASIALHLINACLIWSVAHKLTQRWLIAGIAAAVFALHPGYVEAVAWISNSASLLAVSTSLLSLWCFMKADDARRKRRAWYVLSLVSFAATLLFHPESGIILIVIAGYRLSRMPAVSNENLRSAAVELLPFAIPAALYFAVHRWMMSQDYLYISNQFSLGTHMFKQYVGYLGMLAFPRTTAHLGSTFASPAYAAGAALLIAGLGLLLVFDRARPPAGRLAALWLAVAILPITTLDSAPLGPAMFGRKLYLAGPPFALVVAFLAAPVIEAVTARARRPAVAGLLAVGLLLAALAGLQVVQNQESVTYPADEYQSFVAQLTSEYPDLAPGTRLYILRLPPGLGGGGSLGGAIFVTNLVALYYDDVDVIVFPPPDVLETKRAQDVTFSYTPP